MENKITASLHRIDFVKFNLLHNTEIIEIPPPLSAHQSNAEMQGGHQGVKIGVVVVEVKCS